MLNIDLTNRVAVVTGGGGELGRTICRTLAGCGAKIAVCYFGSEDKAGEVVRSIGSQARKFKVDVTDFDQVLSLRHQVLQQLGQTDIIVNNAVVQYEWTSVLEQDLKDYESQYRSCVLQNVHMAKAFVPDMVAKNYGRVIAMNTECAMQNFPSQSAYVSGKRGMDGVLRVLAKEVGKHQVTVNQVAPGWIRSDKIRADERDIQAEYVKGVPLHRPGTDQEVANVVAFLASDLASFITGAYIPVCGGNVMPTI